MCPDEETGELYLFFFFRIFICLVQPICDIVCDGDRLYMLSMTAFSSLHRTLCVRVQLSVLLLHVILRQINPSKLYKCFIIIIYNVPRYYIHANIHIE